MQIELPQQLVYLFPLTIGIILFQKFSLGICWTSPFLSVFKNPLLESSLFCAVLTGIKYALLLGRGPKLRGFQVAPTKNP